MDRLDTGARVPVAGVTKTVGGSAAVLTFTV